MTIQPTAADREAAANWCAEQPFPSKQAEGPMIAAGEWDHHSLVQAFARRAQQAREEALGDQLEAWLHTVSDQDIAYFGMVVLSEIRDLSTKGQDDG